MDHLTAQGFIDRFVRLNPGGAKVTLLRIEKDQGLVRYPGASGHKQWFHLDKLKPYRTLAAQNEFHRDVQVPLDGPVGSVSTMERLKARANGNGNGKARATAAAEAELPDPPLPNSSQAVTPPLARDAVQIVNDLVDLAACIKAQEQAVEKARTGMGRAREQAELIIRTAESMLQEAEADLEQYRQWAKASHEDLKAALGT